MTDAEAIKQSVKRAAGPLSSWMYIFLKTKRSCTRAGIKDLVRSGAWVCPPVEAAEDVKASVLPAVEVHAEDGGEDEQHHGEVKHHHHRGLQGAQKTELCRMEKAVDLAVQCGIYKEKKKKGIKYGAL